MYAEVREKQTGKLLRNLTEPLSNYNLFVLDRPLKGQSNINFTNTNKLVPSTGYIGNVAAIKWVHFDSKQLFRFVAGYRNSLQGSDSFSSRIAGSTRRQGISIVRMP